MSRFEKILVPIDFSDHSKAALDTAVEIAPSFGAKIHLLHCYQLQPGAISPYGIALPTNYAADLRAAAARQLKEWQEKISTDAVEIEASLSCDFPSQAIALRAEELGADLIVMGTRGLSGIKHVVLGSVAERTIRTAPCAVLTVNSSSALLVCLAARIGVVSSENRLAKLSAVNAASSDKLRRSSELSGSLTSGRHGRP